MRLIFVTLKYIFQVYFTMGAGKAWNTVSVKACKD